MKLASALRLARVSLLPTVWTNVLAGAALAGRDPLDLRVLLAMAAVSLAYTGGMFLNDAFDRDFDARLRPDRPIPAGEVSARQVFAWGYAMLGASVLLPAAFRQWRAAMAGVLLCLAIVLYDAHHKHNPLSPLLMGSCRLLVYVVAALAVGGQLGPGVWLGAAALLGYLIGLTHAAKGERLARLDRLWPLALLLAPLLYAVPKIPAQPAVLLPAAIWAAWTALAVRKLVRRGPGDVGSAVGALLAGISIVDAIMLAGAGDLALAIAALILFALTMRLQRWVQGT